MLPISSTHTCAFQLPPRSEQAGEERAQGVRMEKLEHIAKIADLFEVKDKHGRTYLVSKYENNTVYYVFKNDFQHTNNAEYILYAKKFYV